MADNKGFYEIKNISLDGSYKKSIKDIIKHYLSLRKKEEGRKERQVWVFRGQPDSKWYLRTTLERAIIAFADNKKPPSDTKGQQLDNYYNNIPGDKFAIEADLIRKFRRKAHRYTNRLPQEGNLLEWLSIMQHYGAPTRLLDFQYSFFGALYFALERASGDCSVWAVNSSWIEKKYERLIYGEKKPNNTDLRREIENADQIKEEDFKESFWNIKNEAVKTANPYILNERLICQQGLFLYPTNINVSFHDNLEGLVSGDIKDAQNNLVKLDIKAGSQAQRNEVLRFLRDMNIDRSVLFPDLQGYAESLRVSLAYPKL